MKKKLVSALLCATMAASLLAGCGSGNTSDTGNSDKKGDAKLKPQAMARHSISTAGMKSSRAVSQTTILITRRWMQHMAKSEILM